LELGDYLQVVRKRWLPIALLAIAGLAVAALASLLTPAQYRASTLVFVAVQSTGQVTELVQGGTFAQNQVKTFAEHIDQPIVIEPVIKELGLDETAAELGALVSARPSLETSNIEISVTLPSPAESAELANAVTASFAQVVADITRPANGEPSPVTISVVRPATVPATPEKPNTVLNLGLGLLAGIAAGVAIAVLREALDRRVRNSRDVQALTNAPIIGRIAFDEKYERQPLAVHADPRSPAAEAFRTLRTNLRLSASPPGGKTYLITSAVGLEGKTTTAANLAIAIADTGVRVALVDGDLRKPMVATYMGAQEAPGLSDVLAETAYLPSALHQATRTNLFVLPAGTRPQNPSEILGSEAMRTLLVHIENEFDVVLIDVPPLLPVTDAAILSERAHGVIMVVAVGQTERREVAAALSVLEGVGAPLTGIVLNMLPSKSPELHAYRYGRYGRARYAVRPDTAPVSSRSR
jgi:succinoglycan biosynthesis transport protein ExoP